MGKLTAKDSDMNNKRSSKKKKVENSSKNGSTDTSEVDINKLIVKQQETCSIIEQKKDTLVSNQLSYLEYIELQEEIGRLNDLRDNFQGKINALRKLRKKSDSNSNK